MADGRRRITMGNVAAIMLGLFATVGIGTLALVSYLFYLTPGPRDRFDGGKLQGAIRGVWL